MDALIPKLTVLGYRAKCPIKYLFFMRNDMNLAVLPPPKVITPSPDLLALLRQYQLMPQLIRGLVIDRAIAPFTCTTSEKELALNQFYQNHQLDTQSAIETWLQQNHIANEELETIALRPIRIEKFKLAQWGSELKSCFLKRKASLDQVVYSLLRTQDLGLAQELYYRLKDNEQSFAELAHQFSEGPEKRTEGRIGPVPFSQPHPAIRHLLVVSQAGQLWSPRQVDEWFVIVRLEQLIPVHLNAAVEQYLLNELFETWAQTEVAQQSPSILHDLETLPLEEVFAA
jgi:parvulin-like peptidyl-prolyl isomerase